MEARKQARILLRCDEEELVEVVDEMVQLPALEMSLQLPLPRLLSPELELLRTAVADQSVEEIVDALPAALARVDSPSVRQALARAVLVCRDRASINSVVAAAAVVELATAPTSRLLRNSLIEALAVSAGATPTPGGLLVAAR
ncbi:MAG: hypothetical protein ABR540_18750 [Acidimicrobiales bacterium]